MLLIRLEVTTMPDRAKASWCYLEYHMCTRIALASQHETHAPPPSVDDSVSSTSLYHVVDIWNAVSVFMISMLLYYKIRLNI